MGALHTVRLERVVAALSGSDTIRYPVKVLLRVLRHAACCSILVTHRVQLVLHVTLGELQVTLVAAVNRVNLTRSVTNKTRTPGRLTQRAFLQALPHGCAALTLTGSNSATHSATHGRSTVSDSPPPVVTQELRRRLHGAATHLAATHLDATKHADHFLTVQDQKNCQHDHNESRRRRVRKRLQRSTVHKDRDNEEHLTDEELQHATKNLL